MSKMTMSEAGRLGALKTLEIWHNRYKENPKHCLHCSKELAYEKRKNKFCDQSCAAICNNALKKKKEKKCICCGVVILDCKFWQTRKYCSTQCQVNYRWEQTKRQFITLGKLPYKTTAKRYLAEIYGKQCSICGVKEWVGQPILLILDHIDGDSNNCDIINLRLICSNCDAQLPTYKGRNKGNGRYKRKMRYREGKSY